MTLTAGVRIMTDCRNCKHYIYEEKKGITVNIIKMKCAIGMDLMTSLDCPKYAMDMRITLSVKSVEKDSSQHTSPKVTFNELL